MDKLDGDDLLIGVDGGGSVCRVAMRAGDGPPVRFTHDAAANVTTDASAALDSVVAAVTGALHRTAIPPAQLARARIHLALAGILDETDAAMVSESVGARLPLDRITVSDDRTAHAMGALAGGDGYVAAIGTGSTLAAIRSRKVRPLGGWGFRLGDEASGAALGRAALSRTLHCVDGLERHGSLTRALLADHGGSAGIVRFAQAADPRDFATLAPRVTAAADAGDAIASDILRAGADYLDRGLVALGIGDGDRLCLTGGLATAYAPLLRTARRARLVPPEGDAVDGALILARELPVPGRG